MTRMISKTVLATMATALLAATGTAHAFQIDTGNPNLSLRWDNTLRYNLGMRVDKRNDKIANSATTDEGTYSFDRGDIVTNRVDLLSELDVLYRSDFGLHVSGTGWYDHSYDDHEHTNPNPPLSQIPSYEGGEYSHYTKRYYSGPSGELLDALIFSKFHLGSVPVSVKLGRHTEYWGESLFLNGAMHSVAYAQSPIDLQKGFATPGADAKELFRPLNNLSAQAQLTDTVSLAGQYFLEWDSFRYPEGGTYLGPVDFAFNGPDRQFLPGGLGFAERGHAVEPRNTGEWGLAAHWNPTALDANLGFYIRNYSDKLPQALLTQVGANNSVYRLIYADNIRMYGMSISKNVLGVSVSAETSYRHNTPLNTTILGISPSGAPSRGNTPGARGDTFHALVNALGVVSKTALFDSATWATELTWNDYVKVRSGKNLFYADGYAACTGKDKWDGCATKNYVGLSAKFTAVWYQVFPNVDLQLPVSVSDGLWGNSAVVFGGNQANGSYSAGVGATLFQDYQVDLKYTDYFGSTHDDGTKVTSQNGFTSLLKDRGFVALTLKTTF